MVYGPHLMGKLGEVGCHRTLQSSSKNIRNVFEILGDDSSEEFPRFLPDSSTSTNSISRPPRLLPVPQQQLTASPQAAAAAVMSASPSVPATQVTSMPRYPHIHLPHMACHDYTNKVSYFKPPAKVEVSSSSSNSRRGPAGSQKTAVKPSRQVSGLSGGQRKLNNSTRKTTRAYQEDSDYLAHGTGIPRYEKNNFPPLLF